MHQNLQTAVEQLIVDKILDVLMEEGYGILINNPYPITQTKFSLLSAMFSTGQDCIYAHKQGEILGFIHFVYGKEAINPVFYCSPSLEKYVAMVYGLFAVGGYTLSLTSSSGSWNGRWSLS